MIFSLKRLRHIAPSIQGASLLSIPWSETPRARQVGGREWESNPRRAVLRPLPDLKSGRPTGDVSPPTQKPIGRCPMESAKKDPACAG
jgi:hypothetical protein